MIGLLAGPTSLLAQWEEPPLNTFRAIRELAANHELSGVALCVTGTVLQASATAGYFYLQDATGGLRVQWHAPPGTWPVPGDQVRLAGHALLARDGIAGLAAIDNDQEHPARTLTQTIYLAAGWHPLQVAWFNNWYDYVLQLEWQPPGGRREPLPATVLYQPPAAPDRLAEPPLAAPTATGVRFRAYTGEWKNLPDFAALAPVKRGVASNLDLAIRPQNEHVGVVWDTWLQVTQAGEYQFWLTSDDGSRLELDQQLAVTRLGHAPLPQPLVVTNLLSAGMAGEGSWVQLTGMVEDAYTRGHELHLRLDAEGTKAEVRVATADLIDLRPWLQRRIQATGILVAAGQVNGEGAPLLLVDSPAATALQLVTPDKSPPPQTNQLPWLEQAVQIKNLSQAEAARGYPVRLRGVVTAHTGEDDNFVIQDATRAIFCFWNAAAARLKPKVGEEWEIEGISGAHFAPDVQVNHARYLRPGLLPAPLQPSRDQLINGSLDTQLIELQGIVTAIATNRLTLWTRSGTVVCRGVDISDPGPLRHALVRVTGVCVPERDTNQMMIPGWLAVRLLNTALRVDEPAMTNPWEAPVKHPDDFRRFDAQADALHRVRVRGLVIGGRDEHYYLMDGQSGLQVETAGQVELPPGALVEAAGFPDLGPVTPHLREAVVRIQSFAPLPVPQDLHPETGPGPEQDATRVRVVAQLIRAGFDHTDTILELQSGPRNFLARFATDAPELHRLQPGSRLEVTGICRLTGGGAPAGQSAWSFEIWSPDATAVRVLARPPWWDFQHTLWVLGGLGLIIVLGSIWITVLRRQVEDRSRQLIQAIQHREHLEYQRALESERIRIAQDLHDELGATLTEIRFIGAIRSRDAKVSEPARMQFGEVSEKARQMVASLDEIVWAVNPANDSLPSLVNYLCHVTTEFFRHTEMRIRLEVTHDLPGIHLGSEIRHNVCLAVREALANLLKHSGATEGWLRIHITGQTLQIVVEDNGCGLPATPAARPGNGLANMQSRMTKIGGRFEITTLAGTGTQCHFILPLPPSKS
ncbi:MAG TPA: ATP-binding protein [Verrucomicrobiae bacterium]